MKSRIPLYLLFCFLLQTGLKAEPASVVVLTKQTPLQIVLPDSLANPGVIPHLKTGALELQTALRETLGSEALIVHESELLSGRTSIYLGLCKATEKLGVDCSKFPDYGGMMAEQDGQIHLFGRDRHHRDDKITSAHWSDYLLGSNKALIRFMEKYLSTRFLLPGETGTDYARLQEVRIPANLREEVTPTLLFSPGRVEMFFYYSNNCLGSGSLKTFGGHSWYDAVPAKKYSSSHPEYFAMSASGKRSSHDNHLCISNPEVQELMFQHLLEVFDSGFEISELAQTDGYNPCLCPQCRQYGNCDDPSEKLWILHRDLAQRILEARPGKTVMIISYGPTRNPPQSFHKFPDNVMIELCGYSRKDFATWKGWTVPKGFSTYIYNWGNYQAVGMTPALTPRFVGEQIRLFMENNVRGIYRCGFGELKGLEGPTYYVFGKMLDDPTQDPGALAYDYYQRAYHEAAGNMKTFFETLYKRLEVYNRLAGRLEGLEFIVPENPRVLLTTIYSPDILEIMEKNLARAEALASSDKVKRRLTLVRREFDYARNLSEILHFYNTYRLRPSWEAFNLLAESLDERKAMLDRLFDPAVQRGWPVAPDWPESVFMHGSLRHVVDGNSRMAKIEAPLSWDTNRLREKKILPGVGKKQLTVPAASAPVTGFAFDSAPWSGQPWQELNGIQLGEIAEKSRFKVLYDRKNLYFAVETDLPAERKIHPCGDDGTAWGQDCIEIFLDPNGRREIYYHLIYNPVPDSRYDAAFGLIKDPLHPKFNLPDPAWNGAWKVESLRQAGKWYSLVKIPFSILACEPPAKGSRWTMNIGRESRPPDLHHELSLWSPNLEALSFHDRETFGDVLFE